MSIYQRAKELAAMGFYIFPVRENEKTPLIKDYTSLATNDPNNLDRFWYDTVLNFEHYHNIGIATTGIAGPGGEARRRYGGTIPASIDLRHRSAPSRGNERRPLLRRRTLAPRLDGSRDPSPAILARNESRLQDGA